MFEEPLSWVMSVAGVGAVAFSTLLVYLESWMGMRT